MEQAKALYVNWFSMVLAGSNMIGNFFGSVIRVDADLVHFALTAMFIFMFVMQMKKCAADFDRCPFRCFRCHLHGTFPKYV